MIFKRTDTQAIKFLRRMDNFSLSIPKVKLAAVFGYDFKIVLKSKLNNYGSS